jgi:hypothetical protein
VERNCRHWAGELGRLVGVNRQHAKVAKDFRVVEPSAELDDLAHRVIGAATEVRRLLGPGLLESVYEEALRVELALHDIPFARQVPIGVRASHPSIGRRSSPT